MKKPGIFVFIVLVVLLMATTVAQARSTQHYIIPSDRTSGQTATGGAYRLTSLNWQAYGTADGGSFHLKSYTVPADGIAGGCCCTLLPCILR